jgi:streptogramin lyase
MVLLAGCGGAAGGGARRAAATTTAASPAAAACPAQIRLAVQSRQVLGRGVGPLALEGGTVWVADPASGALVRATASGHSAVQLGGTPISVAVGFGRVWVAERDAGRIVSVDPRSLAQLTSAGVPVPVRVLTGPIGVWGLSLDNASLFQLDPVGGASVRHIDVPVIDPADMVAVGNELWVLGAGEGGLSPVNAVLGRIVRAGFDRPGQALSGLSVNATTIWLGETTGRSLLRVDARTGAVRQLPAPGAIQPIATAPGACGLWVADASGDLAIIDPDTGRALGPLLHIGRSVAALAASGTGVWVTDPIDGTLVRVDLAPGG